MWDTVPDTWLPIWTLVTGFTVPVALTVASMDPRCTGAVVSLKPAPRRARNAMARMATTAPTSTKRICRLRGLPVTLTMMLLLLLFSGVQRLRPSARFQTLRAMPRS